MSCKETTTKRRRHWQLTIEDNWALSHWIVLVSFQLHAHSRHIYEKCFSPGDRWCSLHPTVRPWNMPGSLVWYREIHLDIDKNQLNEAANLLTLIESSVNQSIPVLLRAQRAGFSTSQQTLQQQQQQSTAVDQPAPRLTATGKVRQEVPLPSQEPTKGVLQYALCVKLSYPSFIPWPKAKNGAYTIRDKSTTNDITDKKPNSPAPLFVYKGQH